MNMHDFIFSSINKRTFSCDMLLLHEYAQRRDDLIKVEGEFAKLKWQGCLGTISLIQNMKDILAM